MMTLNLAYKKLKEPDFKQLELFESYENNDISLYIQNNYPKLDFTTSWLLYVSFAFIAVSPLYLLIEFIITRRLSIFGILFVIVFILMAFMCYKIVMQNSDYCERVRSGNFRLVSGTLTNKHYSAPYDEEDQERYYLEVNNVFKIEVSKTTYENCILHSQNIFIVTDDVVAGYIDLLAPM